MENILVNEALSSVQSPLAGASANMRLFQGKEEYGVRLEGRTGVFGSERAARLTPYSRDLALTAHVAKTPVVFSYASASGFKPFMHVRYDGVGVVRRVVMDFEVWW